MLDKLSVKRVTFRGEQVGETEQRLEHELIPLFTQDVVAAYLTKVSYGESEDTSVALCLHTRGNTDSTLIQRTNNVFKSMFSIGQHLDIIFLTKEQEIEIAEACRAFFVR